MSRLASSKTAKIWAERFAQCERSNAPVALRTQGGASLCPGLSPFAPLGRTDRSTRKSSVITQNAGTVPGYFLMVCRPAGPRENKGGAIAPGPYDPGRGCAGLPGLKTI
jgi:hypothetical protein